MQDDRFRVIHNGENRGLSAARSTGIKAARSEFIVRVGSDDKLAPDHLQRTLDAASEHDAEVVLGAHQYFGGISELARTRAPSPTEILVCQPVIVPGMLMKRSLWASLGGFDEAAPLRLGREDTEFCIRLFNAGARTIHLDGVLYLCRKWRNP